MGANEISAWIMDNGLWVVYGTHNPKKAARAMSIYLEETEYAQILELPTREDIVHEFKNAQKRWTRPVEEGEPFEDLKSDGPRRVPYLAVDADW